MWNRHFVATIRVHALERLKTAIDALVADQACRKWRFTAEFASGPIFDILWTMHALVGEEESALRASLPRLGLVTYSSIRG
jgi:hypothetical protein